MRSIIVNLALTAIVFLCFLVSSTSLAVEASPYNGKLPKEISREICRPRKGIKKAMCVKLKNVCMDSYGIGMMWVGTMSPCRRLGFFDGGCQCENYCQWKCKAGCMSAPGRCRWQDGACRPREGNDNYDSDAGRCAMTEGGQGVQLP
jgi:hypothetical protein